MELKKDRTEYYREYHKRNKEKINFRFITRFHLLRCGQKKTDVTLKSWNDLKAKNKNKCLGCGRKETKNIPLCMDHITPPKLKGKHFLKNIQPLCVTCNSIKGINIGVFSGKKLSTGLRFVGVRSV